MERRLFIRNLQANLEIGRIEGLLDAVGEVESATFGAPDPKSGLATAYVVMRSAQGAQDGIERLHGTEFMGHSLVVTYDSPHIPKMSAKKPAKSALIASAKKSAKSAMKRPLKSPFRTSQSSASNPSMMSGLSAVKAKV